MILTGTTTKIELDTGIDLSSATDPKIIYENPNGETGEWDAIIDGTKVYYNTTTTDIVIPNTWKLQSQVTISGGTYKGQVATTYVQRSIPNQ